MGRGIDSYVEDYTAWLYDLHTAPGYLECDNCEEIIEEDSPEAIDFGGCFFCCPQCFQEALLTNDILMEEWEQDQSSLDDF